MQPFGAIPLALLVSMLAIGPSDRAVAQTAGFESDPSGLVTFPTRDVSGLYELYNGERRYNSRSIGQLSLPSEIAEAGAVPAMVILHGSGGEWGGRGARHAAFLARHGIATLVVDSFAARGLGQDTPYLERLRQANLPDQVADAFAALDALAADPRIDADRIGVMGYSMGGISAFLAAYEEIAGAAGLSSNRFALHVPFYAPCLVSLADSRTTGAPVVALWGELDESTYPEACNRQVQDLQDGGSAVTVHWLEGAAHGWNNVTPMTFVPSAPRGSPCDFVVHADGESVESITGRSERSDEQFIDVMSSCSEHGYTMGQHRHADQTANRILLDAIAQHLR